MTKLSEGDHADLERAKRKIRRWPNPKKLPLDGGWGWMVVLGCTLMHLLVAGLSRSYGVVFVQLQERYNSSASLTAGVGGACSAIRMGFSPLATSLSNRFGTRPIIMMGGILIGIGCLLCGFTPNTEFMFFSYSIVVGLGGTFAYAPSLVLVGQYFKKFRGIATGLGSAGSGFGTFGLPPMMNALFGHYGFMGSFMIIGAFMLNVCVCGALHRPLEANILPDISKDTKNTECQESLENNSISDTRDDITIQRNVDGSYGKECNQDGLSSTKPVKDETHSKEEANEFLSVEYEPSGNSQVSSIKLRKVSKSDTDVKEEKKNGNCANLSKYIDFSLCKDPVFMIFMLALGFHTMSYMAGQMLVPANAKSQGHSQTASVFLLSILGICDMCGRTASGFIFDAPFLKQHRHLMYNTAIVLSASSQYLWAFFQPYSVLILGCVIHGIFNGCVVSQRAVILADLLGVEKLSSSFGLTVFVQGCGIFIGPPFAGFLKDQFGVYTWSFVFTATASLLGAVLFFLSTHSHLWQCRSKSASSNQSELS